MRIKLKIGVEHPATNKKLALYVFLLLSYGFCMAQEIPKPNFGFEVKEPTGKKYGLFNWLEKNVPEPVNEECRPTWGFFYFRVNNLGKVDSLWYSGNLRKVVFQKIIDNIYATEGRWQIPKETKPEVFSWYIFPYFDFGGKFYADSNCSEADKLLQKTVIDLSEIIGNNALKMNEEGAYLIVPSLNGGGYIKL
jgi:hypothetical protein